MSHAVRVPFVDLTPTTEAVRRGVLRRVEAIVDAGQFAGGDAVDEFEQRFAEYCGIAHCVGTSSGLDALRLALLGAGARPGVGVVVPAHTFAATFEAVIQCGSSPVVADVTDSDYTLDLEQVEPLLPDASFVVPVHLYGQMADMLALARLAATHDVQVVEDACQAHGAQRGGVRPGEAARAAAFSFYPAKNLGAWGDAGALVTSDEGVARRAVALRVHGETRKYHHESIGYTARLDNIQAAVLAEKLVWLDEWNKERRAAAAFYLEALADLPDVRLPSVAAGSDPVWHLFVIRTPEPERLARHLQAHGIQTARHYPEPPHLAPAYRPLGYARGDFPVAETLARECLSLPLYPGIRREQLAWVCESIRTYFGDNERERVAAAAR